MRLLPAAALALLLSACGEAPPPVPAQSRLVVLGFDGMDPQLVERWMDEGLLPEFDRLRRDGHYQPLGTSNPPQSPVAWSSFATGLGPGGHGIHDFLRRDPATYQPDFSIARYTPPSTLDLFGWRLPFGEGTLENLRQGQSFWMAATEQGQRATVLRVPVTYPPEPIEHMLSGMGVPDLLGSQGTYTYYSTRPPPPPGSGSRVVQMRLTTDGRVQTQLDGPAHPLSTDATPLSLPLILQFDADGAQIELGGQTRRLAVGEWSDWWPLQFEH
ncbi:MAG: alkaline phosphatase family protein, partial [Xanthomonadales bacterium]|nr:alkaline phosphatase family protein [Xanthomonadales bacterium]